MRALPQRPFVKPRSRAAPRKQANAGSPSSLKGGLLLLLLPLLLLICTLGPASRTGAAAAAGGVSAAAAAGSEPAPGTNTNGVFRSRNSSGAATQPPPSAPRNSSSGSTAADEPRGNTTATTTTTTTTTARQLSLPCLHTRPPPELGWPPMRCPAESIVQMTEEYDKFKALHLTLVHAPLPGVNSTHIEWWFRSALPSTIIYRGRSWDAYKLWHPVDHVLFERTSITDPRVSDPELGNANTTVRPPAVPAVRIVEQFRGPINSSAASSSSAAAAASDAGAAAGGSGGAPAAAATTVKAYGSGGGRENATYVTYPLDATLVLNDTQRNMHR
ncbi:hypothetical protein PLESTM_001724600 [Pleodorina starrii]|nr:hypothetical protein PLESTM_001724600 [Pleodorina starrii]